MRRYLAVGAAVCVVLLWVWKFVALTPRREPALLQSAVTLPAPAPLEQPAIPMPSVTVTSPPPTLPVVQVTASRPSIWEIRAELKRGMWEWEFPHYLNAPHYGSGPDSPHPSQMKPHMATLWAGE
ncbi:MAG: hypothetical protein NZ741_02650 [Armatimonadetes bacterium]|nr:hypothetical protein [Armatimonadota bacterium]